MFEIEKIIDKRRQGKKVEYLVVGKDILIQANTHGRILRVWLHARIQSMLSNKLTFLPCVKKGDDVCSCGDTGCDGPPVMVYQATCSSGTGTEVKETSVPVVPKRCLLYPRSSTRLRLFLLLFLLLPMQSPKLI